MVKELNALLDATRALLWTYDQTPFTYEDAYYKLKKNYDDWNALRKAFLDAGGVIDWENKEW
jgi:hypothetical protein